MGRFGGILTVILPLRFEQNTVVCNDGNQIANVAAQILSFRLSDGTACRRPVFESQIKQREETLEEEIVPGLRDSAVQPNARFNALQKLVGPGIRRGQCGRRRFY